MPKGYIIAHINVTDDEAFSEYARRAGPVWGSYGPKYVVRGGPAHVAEGAAAGKHYVIEFPSYEAALAAYNDPEYQVTADVRRASADSIFVIAEGSD